MDKISDLLNHIAKVLTVITVAVMSAAVIMEVFTRNVLGFSFAWAEELARYLLVWVSFIGGSIAFKNLRLVGFDFFLQRASGKTKTVLLIFGQVLLIAFILVIIYLSWQQITSPSVLRQVSPGLGLPMFWAYVAIPIGFVIMLIHAITRLKNILKG